MSPIFDSGTSLWYNKTISNIRPRFDIDSKPFKSLHSEQIKLVKNFDWLNFDLLKNFDDEFYEIYKTSDFVERVRADALLAALKTRIRMLEEEVSSAQ